jgi:hypothetical protein
VECTAYCGERNIDVMLGEESFLNFVEEHVRRVIKKCEHKLHKRGQDVDGEKEGKSNSAVVWGHERRTPFVSTITANFPNFHPCLLDTLHDTQRHIEVMGNLVALFTEGKGLVNDPLLEVLRVVILDWCGGFFASHGRQDEECKQ